MIRKAMILAAGYGTRLRPLTHQVPKPLVPVGMRSMLAHHLERLASLGIQEVMINLHHLPDKIPAQMGDGSSWGLKLHYSEETPEILGTGGGLMQVREFFEGEEAFFLLNGDILHDIDLEALAKQHQDTNAVVTLALRPHPGKEGMGWIGTDENERVWRVPEMDPQPQSTQKRMFTGLSLLSPAIFPKLPPQGFGCILRAGVRGLLEAGLPIQGYLDTGSMWVDIGTPASYLQANLDALADPRFLPPPETQHLDAQGGPVWLAKESSSGDPLKWGGWVLVGEQATIGEGAMLERVVVWPGARIPANARMSCGIAFADQFVPVPPEQLRPPRPLHPDPTATP